MTDDEWRAVVERVSAARSAEGPVTLLVDCAYFLYGARDPRAFLRHLRPLVGRVDAPLRVEREQVVHPLRPARRRARRVRGATTTERADRRGGAAATRAAAPGPTATAGAPAAITRLLADPELARACDAERDGAEGAAARPRRRVQRARPRARPEATRATRGASS